MFVNKLTADDKYSLLNIVNLTQRIQIHLSQKQNIFSEYTCTILKFKLNFEHFRKKMTPHSLYISQVTDSEIRG